uniref:Uncharacterized protein n=1 Tax=Aegilops tauschii subsp. strangulata TaxID=200361 RepID=A0A453N8A0_AEGTS
PIYKPPGLRPDSPLAASLLHIPDPTKQPLKPPSASPPVPPRRRLLLPAGL